MLLLIMAMLMPKIKIASAVEGYGAEIVDKDVLLQPYNYPAAIYVESVDTTFFTYAKDVGTIGKVYAKQYNHTTGEWTDPTYVGEWNNDDGHKCPAIGYLWNGSLIIFHGNHGANPSYMTYRVSTNAWDTTTWNPEAYSDPYYYNYAQAVSYSDQLQLFVRNTTVSYAPNWIRFTFNSSGFWLDKTIIVLSGWYDYGIQEGFYALFHKGDGNDDRIYMGAALWNHTKQTGWRSNLYFMYSEDRGYTWKTADGTSVSIPVEHPYTSVLVEETANHHGEVFALRDRNNNIQMLSVRGNPSGVTPYWNAPYISYWDGSSWTGDYIKNQNGQVLNSTSDQVYSDPTGVAYYGFRDADFNRTTFWGHNAPINQSTTQAKLSRWMATDTPFIFVKTLELDICSFFLFGYAVQDHADPYEQFVSVTDGGVPDEYRYGYFTWNLASYLFTFKGVYNEDTGDFLPAASRAVNITAYFVNQEPETFELNNTYWYGAANQPLYFSMNTSVNRQYWLSEGENSGTIYVYDTTLSAYTVEFIDLAGALEDYAFIEIKRYIGTTLMTVEKRKVDAEDKITASLKQGEKYTLEIKDGSTYTFGDVLFTSTSTVTLVLKGTEFPQNIILAYRYVRIWGYRHNNQSSISVIFEETQSKACDVEIDIQFENGTSVSGTYPYNYNDVTSFNHTWASAAFNTTYVTKATITHPDYGEIPYNTILARGFTGNIWDFPLGTIPNLATANIVPLFIILGSFLLFSKINAYLAAFVGVVVAIFLTWLHWISISATALISALVFAILLAMTYKKKEETI